MSRQKELVKNAAILTFGRICTQCVNFFLLPLYTAILDTSDYGTFDLMITYGSLLLPIVGCQLDQGIFRFLIEYRNNQEEQIKLFSSVLTADIILSILYILILGILVAAGVLQHGLFLAIYVIFQVFMSLLMQFVRGLGKNKIYAMASFLSASMTVIFNVIMLVIVKLQLTGLFLATICAQVFTMIYLCAVVRLWEYMKIESISKKTLKMVVKYSLPLIPNELSWWGVNVSDRIIVAHILGVSVNGIYTVANKFSNMFISVYNIFNLSWTETVSLHYNDNDREEFIGETIITVFQLFSCMCFIIVAVMPFIFPVLINEQYSAAYDQIIILLYAMLLRVAVGLYSAVYVAMKESMKIAYTSAAAAIINITVNLLLIHKIGLYAASLSTAVAFGVMSIVRIIDIRKRAGIRISIYVLGITVFMAVILAITYYMNITLLNVAMFFAVCIYTIIMNHKLLESFIKMIREK